METWAFVFQPWSVLKRGQMLVAAQRLWPKRIKKIQKRIKSSVEKQAGLAQVLCDFQLQRKCVTGLADSVQYINKSIKI